MAKISPVSIKYMIYASFKSEGPLEKPDVIGAIFGQTEGLLGTDLEMRELQKEGKIGRIEVDLEIVDGKSIGEIRVPSAMDKSETTLIAASLETINRIGPTEAEIKIAKIEDVRERKREYILDRAKELLNNISMASNSSEMSKALKEESRASKIQEYGEERLPAGNLSSNEIIVVEGRADVINLLKNRIENVIGMNGTKLPAEISKLGEKKGLIVFVDGDRGGKLIAKNVISNANVAYVAVAPDGKEVEELTGKEILMALRKKTTVSEFLRLVNGINGNIEPHKDDINIKKLKLNLKKLYEGIKETKSALLLDNNLDVIRKVNSRELSRTLNSMRKDIFAIILDGTVTISLVKICEEKNINYLAATNFGAVKDTKITLISL